MPCSLALYTVNLHLMALVHGRCCIKRTSCCAKERTVGVLGRGQQLCSSHLVS